MPCEKPMRAGDIQTFSRAQRRARFHGNVRMGHNHHGNCFAIAIHSGELLFSRKGPGGIHRNFRSDIFPRAARENVLTFFLRVSTL
jgi:hypothetical protein